MTDQGGILPPDPNDVALRASTAVRDSIPNGWGFAVITFAPKQPETLRSSGNLDGQTLYHKLVAAAQRLLDLQEVARAKRVGRQH